MGDIIIEGWIKTTDGRELIFTFTGEPSITGNISTPKLFTK
jgi:hypothetical protein